MLSLQASNLLKLIDIPLYLLSPLLLLHLLILHEKFNLVSSTALLTIVSQGLLAYMLVRSYAISEYFLDTFPSAFVPYVALQDQNPRNSRVDTTLLLLNRVR